MSERIIIGNSVAIIAAIIMVYTGVLKNKRKILFFQTIQIFLLVVSNFVLGGISGGIVNITCILRNILEYKDKLNVKIKLIISAITIYLSLRYNNLGLLGLLPMISAVVYLWLINIKDIIKFKCLIIFTNITWLIYDWMILSFVMVVFDSICVITNFVTIIRIKKDRKKQNEKNELEIDENQKNEKEKKVIIEK